MLNDKEIDLIIKIVCMMTQGTSLKPEYRDMRDAVSELTINELKKQSKEDKK